jgi:hypothetical protein
LEEKAKRELNKILSGKQIKKRVEREFNIFALKD